MEEITWKQLSIHKKSHYIHVDNYPPPSHTYKTYCGNSEVHLFDFLKLLDKLITIKICKKCSIIYRRKYGHSLEGFIAGLKVRGKLFINN